jgi:hypothetical protein
MPAMLSLASFECLMAPPTKELAHITSEAQDIFVLEVCERDNLSASSFASPDLPIITNDALSGGRFLANRHGASDRGQLTSPDCSLSLSLTLLS